MNFSTLLLLTSTVFGTVLCSQNAEKEPIVTDLDLEQVVEEESSILDCVTYEILVDPVYVPRSIDGKKLKGERIYFNRSTLNRLIIDGFSLRGMALRHPTSNVYFYEDQIVSCEQKQNEVKEYLNNIGKLKSYEAACLRESQNMSGDDSDRIADVVQIIRGTDNNTRTTGIIHDIENNTRTTGNVNLDTMSNFDDIDIGILERNEPEGGFSKCCLRCCELCDKYTCTKFTFIRCLRIIIFVYFSAFFVFFMLYFPKMN